MASAVPFAFYSFILELRPQVHRELAHWRERAMRIPDPLLREGALSSIADSASHSEGAAMFGAFASRERRQAQVKLLVAFQMLADYLDTISEREDVEDVYATNVQLHKAMAVAVGAAEREDYYALHPCKDDGGYLDAIVSTCQEIVATLPSFEVTRELQKVLTSAYGESQALHHMHASEGDAMRVAQTRDEIARHPELSWHEVVVAESSTLAILALLAAAADPHLTASQAEAVQSAYYPYTNCLNIMLDSLVDMPTDRATGDIVLLDGYDSWDEARARLAFLASSSREMLPGIPKRELHEVFIAAMTGYYLSDPNARTGMTSPATAGILDALGPLVRVGTALQGWRASALSQRADGRLSSATRRGANWPGLGRKAPQQ